MAGIFFRPAQPNDCEELAALVNSAYRGDSSKAGWTTEADLLGGQRTDPDTLRALVNLHGLPFQQNRVILMAFAEELLAGCVLLERRGSAAYLGMLTVRPSLQATGLGKQILAAAESWARAEWGAVRIEMTVIEQRTELLAWYERRGYARTNRREPFPYGDERFGLPKRQDLVFLVLEKRLEFTTAAPPPNH